jgi:hypothetical protein
MRCTGEAEQVVVRVVRVEVVVSPQTVVSIAARGELSDGRRR